MSLPKMTTAVDNISKLDTRPNAVNGLTADELKAKFDKAPEDIKRFLNEVLIPALDGAITLDALGAVPKTRKVNGKALSADIELGPKDMDYSATIDGTQVANVNAALNALNTLTAQTKYDLEVEQGKPGVVLYSGTLSGTAESKTFSCATTLAEVSAAYNAKNQLLLKIQNGSDSQYWILPLVYFIDGQTAVFSARNGDTIRTATLSKRIYIVGNEEVEGSVWTYAENTISDVLPAEDVSYSGEIDGTTVANVEAALDALAARKGVVLVRATYKAATDSITADKTFSEIKAARNAGQEVICLYMGKQTMLGTTMLRLDGTPTATLTFRSAVINDVGITVNLLTVDSSDVWTITRKQIDAAMVQYSGKVGSETVATVKAALDGLAVGKPLDMTEDYVASGTEYIEKWATMAKVVNGVASTTEYRVAQGQYVVREEENSLLYYVTIYPSALGGNDRMVSYVQIEEDYDFQFYVYNVGTPGETEKLLLNIGSDGSFTISNGKDAFPPATFVISLVRNADGTFTADEKLVSILPAYRRGDSILCEYTDKLNDVGPVMLPVNRAHLVSTGFAPSEEDWIEFATTEIQYGDGDEELSFYRVEATYENNTTTWKDYSTRKMPRLPEREASNAGKFLTADSRGVAKWASLPTYDGGVS